MRYHITVEFLDGGTLQRDVDAPSLSMAVDQTWHEFPYAADIVETQRKVAMCPETEAPCYHCPTAGIPCEAHTFDLDQLVDDAEARFIRFVNEITDHALREHRAAFPMTQAAKLIAIGHPWSAAILCLWDAQVEMMLDELNAECEGA